MPKAKSIQAVGPDGRPIQIELINNPRPKKEKHKPRESSIVESILNYLNGLPGVKAKKRHQSIYQRNEPDIDCCALVYIPEYITKSNIRLNLCKYVSSALAIAYKFEVKKPGEKSTPAQIETQKQWIMVGVRVHVIYSKEDVRNIMVEDGFDPESRGETKT